MAGSTGVGANRMLQHAASEPAIVSERPIDLVHLSKYTMGDKNLEREVLNLFATQSALYLNRLREAKNDRAWLEAVHTLKGSATGVGAWRVANYAGRVERLEGEARTAISGTAIDELSQSVAEVNDYIHDLMGTDTPQ